MSKVSAEDRRALYSDHRVQAILNKFTSSDLTELTPSFDLVFGVRYLDAEELIGGSPPEVVKLMETLYEHDVLSRKFCDKIVICPSCASPNFPIRYYCPYCSSLEIERKSLLVHIACGAMDGEDSFKREGKMVCPRCKAELRQEGVDFKRLGAWFVCRGCERRFDAPTMKHFCRSCKRNFTFKEAILVDTYSYVINKEAELEFKVGFMFLTPIQETLGKLNYEVKIRGQLQGSSGAFHTFDVVGLKNIGEVKDAVVVDIVSSDRIVDEKPVIALFAKVYDTNPSHPILVASPELSENGRSCSALYKIILIEARTADEVVKKLLQVASSWSAGALIPQPIEIAAPESTPPKEEQTQKAEVIPTPAAPPKVEVSPKMPEPVEIAAPEPAEEKTPEKGNQSKKIPTAAAERKPKKKTSK